MLILLRKSQMGLFATIPVHVKGSVRKDGTRVADHMSVRRKKLEPHQAQHQGGLFGDAPAAVAAVGAKLGAKLSQFLARHGGAARMADTLNGFTPEQRAKMLDMMATLGGVSANDVHQALQAHGKPEQVAPSEPDLFSQPEASAPAPAPAAPAGPRAMTDLSEDDVKQIKEAARYLKDVAYSTANLVDGDKKAMVLLSSELGKSGRGTLIMDAFNVTRDVAHSINNGLDVSQPRTLRAVDMEDAFTMFPKLRGIIDAARSKPAATAASTETPVPHVPEPAKAAEETSQAPAPQAEGANVPPGVRHELEGIVERLKGIRQRVDDAASLDERFGSRGRYEADALDNVKGELTGPMGRLARLREVASKKGVDLEATLTELGLPSFEPSSGAREWLDGGKKPAPAPEPDPAPVAETPVIDEPPSHAMTEPKVMHRAVSPEEWEHIKRTGEITGGANSFNAFDQRKHVFFGAEASAGVIRQGEDVTRRADYQLQSGELGARFAKLLEQKKTLSEQAEAHKAELLAGGKSITGVKWDPKFKRLSAKLTELQSAIGALQSEFRASASDKIKQLRAEDATRGYTSVVLETRPIDGGRRYTGKHSGMGDEDEFGFDPGHVKLADVTRVRYMKDGKQVREEPGPAAAAPAEQGPREGERNSEGLVFRDGRWHREDEAVQADYGSMIRIAADSIGKLRASDVDRVLEQNDAKHRSGLAEFIKTKRPDLSGDVDEVMADLGVPAAPIKPAADEPFMRPEDKARGRLDSLAVEVAAMITEESHTKDFAASEMPKAIEYAAEGTGVTPEALRQRVLEILRANRFDISPARLKQVERALTAGGDIAKPTSQPASAPAPTPKVPAGTKLRAAGQALVEKSTAEANRDRNTNTARRARMASGAEADARAQAAIGATMVNIADAIDAGQAHHLNNVTTRAAVEMLDRLLRRGMANADRHLSYADTLQRKGRPPEPDDIRAAELPATRWGDGADRARLLELLKGKRGAGDLRARLERGDVPDPAMLSELKKHLDGKQITSGLGWWNEEAVAEQARLHRIGVKTNLDLRLALTEYVMYRDGPKKADPIKAAERALVGQKVGIDFFPTPKALASRMANLAGIKPGDIVLEPSAGSGNLADAAKQAGAKVDAIEISDQLRALLEAKGHELRARDFLDFESGPVYDHVLMNPPFGGRADAAHIRHAWDMVKPGGKLVSIAGEGVFGGSDRKAVEFREWLDEHGATVEHLPDNTFMGADQLAQTGANARLVVLTKPAAAAVAEQGPQDGEINAEGLVFRDGRWRREAEPEPVAEAAPAEPVVDPAVEHAEDKADLAEELMRAPDGDKVKELIQKVAAGPKVVEQPKPKPRVVRRARATPTPDDLDPTSANYRYRDTGQIAGSRKDMAAEQIRRAGRTGARLRTNDIDWHEIETNPREAEDLITKSNLFGQVDWAGLREAGMTPAAGFLVDRVYASVKAEPDGDGPMGRRDYALGLETLRDRMERCKTPDEVTTVLGDIRDEINGVMMTATESEEYQRAVKHASDLHAAARAAKEPGDALYAAWNQAQSALNAVEWQQSKRTDRKWKPDPELAKQIDALKPAVERAHQSLMAHIDAHPELKSQRRDHGDGYSSFDNDLEWEASKARKAAEAIKQRVKTLNVLRDPMTRAWSTLGPKFLAAVNYRSYKGSEAFQGHVTAAKQGKITDWSWAEKDVTRTPRTTAREKTFQLAVAEHFERRGGRAVTVDGTMALKKSFGLRDVQSGNWVLNDPSSAAWHVQKTAEAFADLADLLGVPDEHVSMHGRLAMAFGARGKGNAGFAGAARAHYEPVQRVINLTKMGGGGALGHEWFHAIDNMAKEAEGGGAAGKEEFASENPSLLPPGELRDAFTALRDAITTGPHQHARTIAYTAVDVKNAHHNMDGMYVGSVARAIKAAGNAEQAVAAVEKHFAGRSPNGMTKKDAKNSDTWVTLAVAFHDGKPGGGEAVVKRGPAMSSFMLEAQKLDAGESGKYWSQHREMAARAFQSWVEDRMEGRGQKNDYLSVYADNKYHVDPLFGPQFPYPAGAERQRINAAFDRVAAAMRQSGTLAKALLLAA